MSEKTVTVQGIKNCARCQQEHTDMKFSPFNIPIRLGNRRYTHWTICPNTKEPIILEVVNDE